MLHAVVSVLLLSSVPAAAPVRVLPREDVERDGRRTLGQFPKNLGRSFVGVFAKDNLFPLLIGTAATGAAFGFDHGAQSAFGGRAPSLSAAASTARGLKAVLPATFGLFVAGRAVGPRLQIELQSAHWPAREHVGCRSSWGSAWRG